MIDKNTIRLLRIPFSFYLMPVYLFALSQSSHIQVLPAVLVFIILHLLVYPSSNGYNSYMDRDEKSIGGLRNPPKPTTELFYITLLMDLLAVILAYVIKESLAGMILIYILVSRAYSYRGIRLKKYPLAGFLTVTVFQGGFTYLTVYSALNRDLQPQTLLLPMFITSCLIAANYPLTQIYQHKEDQRDGVRTISMAAGYRGTFLLSGIFFLISGILMSLYFNGTGRLEFILFLAFSLPVIIVFIKWFSMVSKSREAASFDNAMRMNTAGAAALIIYFTVLILINRGHIF
jgi:1,4-dihydroxy-2-naphthoate polyprenyltransferase